MVFIGSFIFLKKGNVKRDDIIDQDNKQDFELFDSRMKYAFTIFALLDVVSFLRGIDFVLNAGFRSIPDNFLMIARVLLLISFLFSAIFFILRRKHALTIYFFQFPIRLLFMTLSFGFLLHLFGGAYGTIIYWIVINVVFGLELLRLVYSVVLQRKLK